MCYHSTHASRVAEAVGPSAVPLSASTSWLGQVYALPWRNWKIASACTSGSFLRPMIMTLTPSGQPCFVITRRTFIMMQSLRILRAVPGNYWLALPFESDWLPLNIRKSVITGHSVDRPFCRILLHVEAEWWVAPRYTISWWSVPSWVKFAS